MYLFSNIHVYTEIIDIMLLQVSDMLNRHKAELMEKRYRCNIGLFMCKFALTEFL